MRRAKERNYQKSPVPLVWRKNGVLEIFLPEEKVADFK
jgi:hypothetical protein